MSSPTPKPGLLTTLLEIALSFGLYYLLRAFDVDVFWALTIPAIAVGVVAVAVTVRRRRIDLMGLLVLTELAVTITVSLATQSPRIAALREAAYVLVGGAFCLVTLVQRKPLTHTTAASMATFGDPTREKAFELAWTEEPRYRRWQRLLTATLGVLMVGAGVIRAYILYVAPDSDLAHAVDVSTVVGTVMWVAVFVVPAVLIQPARRIVQDVLERLQADPSFSAREKPLR